MTKELKVIEKETTELVNYAEMIVVSNDEENAAANDFLSTIKAMSKEIDATFDPILKQQKAAMDETRAQKKRHQDPLLNAEIICKGKMKEFFLAQEKIRREAQAKIDEEARKETERLKKEADAAEKAGNTEQAAALTAAASVVQTNRAEAAPATALKGSVMKYWTYRIVDASLIPRAYLTPNTKMLEAQAKATKDTLPIPGIEFYQETTIVAKTK